MATGLVILILIVVILAARVNPFLVSLILAIISGICLTSLFFQIGHAPEWVIPLGVVFFGVALAPLIRDILARVVPPRKKHD